MNRFSLTALFILSLCLPPALPADGLTLTAAEEARVEKILKGLSLEQKVGQLIQYGWEKAEWVDKAAKGQGGSFLNVVGADKVNGIQKKVMKGNGGIPLIMGLDVIHGYRTIFPIPLAEAAAWDPELAERCAAAAALEAQAAGLRWTFAPMMDIARDPRWGRVMEGAGEDPSLGAALAGARVRGFQKERRLAACAKHFVGYGAAEAGRDYNTTEIPPRRLWETYYPPFQAAVDAGVATFMSSFNALNGVPLASDPKGLRGIVKDAWVFGGFIVSDWDSVGELRAHGVSGDLADSARQGILAGVDMDMAGENYSSSLAKLVKDGVVDQALVDDAVRRVLRVKLWLGLFDKPLTDTGLERKVTLSKAHRALAREAAGRSLVLLKNEGVLPLGPGVKKLALVGPLADAAADMLGNWSAKGEAKDVVTLLAGLRARPGLELAHARGCEVTGTARGGFDEAMQAAQGADAVVLALGEHREMSGEAYNRTRLGLPGVQQELAEAVLKLGKPTVLVLFNGRPLALEWEQAHLSAILEAWLPGVEAGNAIADALFGDLNPSGKLPITFPRTVGQVPIYHSVLPTARPATEKKWTSKWVDSEVAPLYPFGFGLSYTRFEYSALEVPTVVGAAGELTVSVTVKNAGEREGTETVQLYLHDKVASLSRPGRELKGWARVDLRAGEARKVSFKLSPRELGFYGRDLKFGWEPGAFAVWVGGDASAELKGEFAVEGQAGFIELAAGRPGVAEATLSPGQALTPPPPRPEGALPPPPAAQGEGSQAGEKNATGPTK